MTRLQEKAQGHTKQAIGQMVGDDELVLEGKQQVRKVEEAAERAKDQDRAHQRDAKDSASARQARN
jgi:uncharacterized protein YjbJ (UPF0337 family)